MVSRHKKIGHIKLFLGSAILAFFVALLFAAINLYGGFTSMLAGRVVLGMCGGVVCLGFALSEWCLKKSNKFRTFLIVTTVAVVSLGFWRLDAEIVWSRGRHINSDQRKGLAEIRDSCPIHAECSCTSQSGARKRKPMGKKFRLPYSPTDRGLISYSLEQWTLQLV